MHCCCLQQPRRISYRSLLPLPRTQKWLLVQVNWVNLACHCPWVPAATRAFAAASVAAAASASALLLLSLLLLLGPQALIQLSEAALRWAIGVESLLHEAVPSGPYGPPEVRIRQLDDHLQGTCVRATGSMTMPHTITAAWAACISDFVMAGLICMCAATPGRRLRSNATTLSVLSLAFHLVLQTIPVSALQTNPVSVLQTNPVSALQTNSVRCMHCRDIPA